jgi:hypothetical protein
VTAGIDAHGVGVPAHAVVQLQPCWPTQLADPLNRLQVHDEPLQELVVLSHTHPWRLMQAKLPN